MAALLGDLVLAPWQRPYQVPTAKVLSTWRNALGPAPLADLQARLLAAVGAEHRDHDYQAVCAGDSGHQLQLCSIDGSVTRVPDIPANREASARLGPPMISCPTRRSVTCWPPTPPPAPPWRSSPALPAGRRGRTGAAGHDACHLPQFHPRPHLFLDRNFPSADRARRMLATGTHVPIRVKPDLALPASAGSCPMAATTAT